MVVYFGLMIVSDRVNKVDNFLHKRVWKLLYLCDRGFSNCHNHYLHQNRSIDRRKQTYAFSLADGDRADYIVPFVIPARSPRHD